MRWGVDSYPLATIISWPFNAEDALRLPRIPEWFDDCQRTSCDVTERLAPTRLISLEKYFCWLESGILYLACVCDVVAPLSLRELILMYWSLDSLVTFGLPDHASDTTDPVPGSAP